MTNVAHEGGSAGHLHQPDPQTAGQGWGTGQLKLITRATKDRAQGKAQNPPIFCSAMPDENCFQAPLLTLAGTIL